MKIIAAVMLFILSLGTGFAETREEILSMIWEMEEEIMGRTEVSV